jgi:hypothetical protein
MSWAYFIPLFRCDFQNYIMYKYYIKRVLNFKMIVIYFDKSIDKIFIIKK